MGKPKNLDFEILFRELVTNKKTKKQVASELGVSRPTLRKYIHATGVLSHLPKTQTAIIDDILTAEFLYQSLVVERKSKLQLAKEIGSHESTIAKRAIITGVEEQIPKPSRILTKELLHELYVKQRMSVKAIAEQMGIPKGQTSIRLFLRKWGIEIRRCGWKNRNGNNAKTGVGDICGSYWSRLVSQARKRNHDITITINDAWDLWLRQNGKCALTGMSLQLASKCDRDAGLVEQTASLDRIESDRGYVHGNVQWVHKDINRMKMDLNQDVFTRWCKRVARHKTTQMAA